MASFGNWLYNFWARIHLILGKVVRLAFYAGVAYLGWYYLSSANITTTPMEDIKLGQIFGVLLGGGIIIITLIGFFHFPEEANPLAEYSIYRSVWGNLGIFAILLSALVYGWLLFFNHFDRPFLERVAILFNDLTARVWQFLDSILKKR